MKLFVRTVGKNGVEEMDVHPQNIDAHTFVEFVLDDGQAFVIRGGISIRDGTSKLHISAKGGRLVIEPEASNVIQVSELRE